MVHASNTVLADRRMVADMSLDAYVQLHKIIQIHYLGDCYEAEFYTHNGNHLAESATGETVDAALKALETKLQAKTFKEWRNQ